RRHTSFPPRRSSDLDAPEQGLLHRPRVPRRRPERGPTPAHRVGGELADGPQERTEETRAEGARGNRWHGWNEFGATMRRPGARRSEEHTSELQSRSE